MTGRRIGLIALSAVVVLGLAAAYFVSVRQAGRAEEAAANPIATLAATAVLAGPRIVFRDGALGADYGKLAAVPLSAPGGPRAVFDVSCERSYATQRSGVCVTQKRGVVQSYGVSRLDASLNPVSAPA